MGQLWWSGGGGARAEGRGCQKAQQPPSLIPGTVHGLRGRLWLRGATGREDRRLLTLNSETQGPDQGPSSSLEAEEDVKGDKTEAEVEVPEQG